MSTAKNKKNEREEREKKIKLRHKYANRITIAKYGKESLDVNDYGPALKHFNDYLLTMSEIKNAGDIFNLRVQQFDPKRELTEMLMMSHIYFEMARMYDAVPKFHPESQKCLEQFVHFSANQPYQIVNSELIRKHLKKSIFKNPDAFRNAYQQIFVQSKKCYVVTYCLGNDHQVTQDCRELKDWLLNYSLGQKLVGIYYRFSSQAVDKWGQKWFVKKTGHYLIRPLLVLFSKTILPFIIK